MSSAYERQVSAAESALRRSEKGTPAEASLEVARAQVHATLALAAAANSYPTSAPVSVSPVPGSEQAPTRLPDAPGSAASPDPNEAIRAGIRALVQIDTSAFADDPDDDQKR